MFLNQSAKLKPGVSLLKLLELAIVTSHSFYTFYRMLTMEFVKYIVRVDNIDLTLK